MYCLLYCLTSQMAEIESEVHGPFIASSPHAAYTSLHEALQSYLADKTVRIACAKEFHSELTRRGYNTCSKVSLESFFQDPPEDMVAPLIQWTFAHARSKGLLAFYSIRPFSSEDIETVQSKAA